MNAIDMSYALMPEQAAPGYFPSVAQLLVAGGDARIALNPVTGSNNYACRPRPDASIAAFGSATATAISETSFFAAAQLRNRLARQLVMNDAADIYADEILRIRRELIELCGLGKFQGLDVVFTASGTDCHLIAAQLTAAEESRPVRMLMVDAAETGSGVPAALTGHHFSTHTALGEPVAPGAPIAGGSAISSVAIPIRLADGTPRPSADIDADFERQVIAAVAAGQRVLLTMVDVSKTGMIAPSVACAVALHRCFPDTLDVLVDACQFRLAPATLQAYLAQGFMVGMTGSKFITGPSFSGALLIPAALAKRLRTGAVADRLQAYSARADWPTGWNMAKQLDEVPNFGLLLRWEGALKELRAFHSVSNAVTTHFLQAFAGAIGQYLAQSPVFEALPVPALQRQPFAATPGWDNIQTIFPFLLCHPAGAAEKRPLSGVETARIYRALQEGARGNERVQLAQPVVCGKRDGMDVSALRMCVSSRLIVEVMQQNGGNEQVVIERALRALDKVAQLVQAA